MNIIIIIASMWAISSLISHARQARLAREQQRQKAEAERIKREQRAYAQRQREMELEQKQLALQARQERVARERMEREQAAAWEKQRKEDAARDARIDQLETRMSQAEFDIRKEEANLDHFADKLRSLDDELHHKEWEIESWRGQKHLSNLAKCEKEKEAIEDKIFAFESKVRDAEKRLDKAQRAYASAQSKRDAEVA